MKEKIPEYEQQEKKEGGILEIIRKKAKEVAVGAIALGFFASCKEQGKTDKEAERIAQEKAAAITEQIEGGRATEGMLEMPELPEEITEGIKEGEKFAKQEAEKDVEYVTDLLDQHEADFVYRRAEKVLQFVGDTGEEIVIDLRTFEIIFTDPSKKYWLSINPGGRTCFRGTFEGSSLKRYGRINVNTDRIATAIQQTIYATLERK